ncbi:hypothetical protein, unlikely [Trypanosoma brucei gambiense DAL972]|uniref:Uncharacterized protein n=1 Tax=Trypanosoma brucei gambiense (strain MHOM/CI/86/DAL972) TaxID=679716 RepID=C9ZYP6_TRYB9|nr:hypothetical protein, unlikely [Trypanosoma brucei gambiense DAL972]CBH14545.1 hypothetical protein, unlikely [Trypanosoma brucei gambiense DAL972]|eukprot:XP_011776811.1 hypothetical protein, unlikely [Trypanosoma brucei gambiense DAL972]
MFFFSCSSLWLCVCTRSGIRGPFAYFRFKAFPNTYQRHAIFLSLNIFLPFLYFECTVRRAATATESVRSYCIKVTVTIIIIMHTDHIYIYICIYVYVLVFIVRLRLRLCLFIFGSGRLSALAVSNNLCTVSNFVCFLSYIFV